MIRTKVLCNQISIARWTKDGGEVNEHLLCEAEAELNDTLVSLQNTGCRIERIDTNHFVANRHNNGGCDEVWVQYTIIYEE